VAAAAKTGRDGMHNSLKAKQTTQQNGVSTTNSAYHIYFVNDATITAAGPRRETGQPSISLILLFSLKLGVNGERRGERRGEEMGERKRGEEEMVKEEESEGIQRQGRRKDEEGEEEGGERMKRKEEEKGGRERRKRKEEKEGGSGRKNEE